MITHYFLPGYKFAAETIKGEATRKSRSVTGGYKFVGDDGHTVECMDFAISQVTVKYNTYYNAEISFESKDSAGLPAANTHFSSESKVYYNIGDGAAYVTEAAYFDKSNFGLYCRVKSICTWPVDSMFYWNSGSSIYGPTVMSEKDSLGKVTATSASVKMEYEDLNFYRTMTDKVFPNPCAVFKNFVTSTAVTTTVKPDFGLPALFMKGTKVSTQSISSVDTTFETLGFPKPWSVTRKYKNTSITEKFEFATFKSNATAFASSGSATALAYVQDIPRMLKGHLAEYYEGLVPQTSNPFRVNKNFFVLSPQAKGKGPGSWVSSADLGNATKQTTVTLSLSGRLGYPDCYAIPELLTAIFDVDIAPAPKLATNQAPMVNIEDSYYGYPQIAGDSSSFTTNKIPVLAGNLIISQPKGSVDGSKTATTKLACNLVFSETSYSAASTFHFRMNASRARYLKAVFGMPGQSKYNTAIPEIKLEPISGQVSDYYFDNGTKTEWVTRPYLDLRAFPIDAAGVHEIYTHTDKQPYVVPLYSTVTLNFGKGNTATRKTTTARTFYSYWTASKSDTSLVHQYITFDKEIGGKLNTVVRDNFIPFSIASGEDTSKTTTAPAASWLERQNFGYNHPQPFPGYTYTKLENGAKVTTTEEWMFPPAQLGNSITGLLGPLNSKLTDRTVEFTSFGDGSHKFASFRLVAELGAKGYSQYVAVSPFGSKTKRLEGQMKTKGFGTGTTKVGEDIFYALQAITYFGGTGNSIGSFASVGQGMVQYDNPPRTMSATQFWGMLRPDPFPKKLVLATPAGGGGMTSAAKTAWKSKGLNDPERWVLYQKI